MLNQTTMTKILLALLKRLNNDALQIDANRHSMTTMTTRMSLHTAWMELQMRKMTVGFYYNMATFH
jgi:hypothetical protein